MLESANLAIATLVAHAHLNKEAQRELQLAVARVLTNAPAGITLHQKQLALIMVLDQLSRLLPLDNQVPNSFAVMATIVLGPRLVTAVSGKDVDSTDPDGLH